PAGGVWGRPGPLRSSGRTSGRRAAVSRHGPSRWHLRGLGRAPSYRVVRQRARGGRGFVRATPAPRNGDADGFVSAGAADGRALENQEKTGARMILEQLTVRNFCLYRGEQAFDLSPVVAGGRHRPIVLFGGINGGGKTTLLDAIQLA